MGEGFFFLSFLNRAAMIIITGKTIIPVKLKVRVSPKCSKSKRADKSIVKAVDKISATTQG